jgi:5-formyltetrahydrofolate cyclo-ligase
MMRDAKALARGAALLRRRAAFDVGHAAPAAHLSALLAGYRGTPVAGNSICRLKPPSVVSSSSPSVFMSKRPIGMTRGSPSGRRS